MENNKKLHRSHSDKVIAGVAGGLAEYFGVDSTIVRIIIVVLAIISFGPLVVAYGLAWLIIPDDKNHVVVHTHKRGWKIVGVIILIIGILSLITHLFWNGVGYMMPMHYYYYNGFSGGYSIFWPIVIILIGLWIISRYKHRSAHSDHNHEDHDHSDHNHGEGHQHHPGHPEHTEGHIAHEEHEHHDHY